MRSVFAAVAIGLISAGQAAASSIMVAEDASPPRAEQAAVEAVPSEGSSSIVYLGEPSTTPKTSAPAAKQVDGTETASVSDASGQNRIMTAWNQAEADAAWAKTSSVASPSIIYMGSPEAVAAKKTNAKVASGSSSQMPMVMRAGITGGAAPSKAPSAPPATTTAPAAPTDGQPKNLQEARERAMR